MNVQQILSLARKHLGNGAAMESSARACLADAISCSDAGRLDCARIWALRSLSFSVGIFHPDFERAGGTWPLPFSRD